MALFRMQSKDNPKRAFPWLPMRRRFRRPKTTWTAYPGSEGKASRAGMKVLGGGP